MGVGMGVGAGMGVGSGVGAGAGEGVGAGVDTNIVEIAAALGEAGSVGAEVWPPQAMTAAVIDASAARVTNARPK